MAQLLILLSVYQKILCNMTIITVVVVLVLKNLVKFVALPNPVLVVLVLRQDVVIQMKHYVQKRLLPVMVLQMYVKI